VVLAMFDGLVDHVIDESDRARLDAVASVAAGPPLANFEDERARELLHDADVLLTHWGAPRIDGAALDRAPSLRLVAHGAGTVRDLVTPAVFERGITVTTAAQANARPVAEYTLAMILLAMKGVPDARERFRGGADHLLLTHTLADVGNARARVGLIGASRVGRLVIELLRPFELDVAVFDPYLGDAGARALGVANVDLDELVSTSRVVSIHAPDLPATRHMIGAPQLARMRDHATLINTARGRLVDHDALERELVSGRLFAVLDVTDPEPLPRSSPLWELPNVYLTPHVAGAEGRELWRLTDLAITEIERFARDEPPLHPVTADELDRIA
jgi:phosphoglycerate dehydrogenase-like enzyme